MSLPKLRQVGAIGVINDLDPYDLPPNAFTMGVNVRFRNGRVTSSPVFKQVLSLPITSPRYLFSFKPTDTVDRMFIGYETGQVALYSNGSQTDYSIAGYTQVVEEANWTSCYLADMIYVNRSDRAPWAIGLSGTQFTSLANMDSAWTCQLLETCGGALVALNVTKTTGTFQTMVKTSSLPTAGTEPASWDVTQPNTNASENILAQMQGPIVDSEPLGLSLVIYGQFEAWVMTPTGDFSLYNYNPLPFSKGSINANCAIEIDSKHYVFGPDDIWMHDGVTQVSIVDQKVRDFIFGSLDLTNYNRCFVVHNKQLHELHFNYVSNDGYTNFSSQNGPNGCNRCAILDYVSMTWTFDDRPYVYFGALGNVDVVETWSNSTATWTTVAGSWQTYDTTAKRILNYVGDTSAYYNLTESLYAFDPVASSLPGMPAAYTNYPVTTAACGFPYIERSAVDMTELGGDLRDYTLISSVWPLGRIDPSTTTMINFSIGASDYYDVAPVYSAWQGYDGQTNYRIDVNFAGRYLSYKIDFQSTAPFSWSGFDFDTQVLGSR